MNDISSPLMEMLTDEWQRARHADRGGRERHREQRTLHFGGVRQTIELTMIRAGAGIAGAQPNGA